MKITFLLMFFCLFSMTSRTQETNLTSNEQAKSKTRKMKGEVIEKKFVNKAGKELGFSEYYLKTKKNEYFIKIAECSVSKEDIISLVGKKITFLVELKDGLWDTDDPNMQSRIGAYVTIIGLI